jgi:hypothetical protein
MGANGWSTFVEGAVKDKVCPVCGSLFKPFSGVHKFCSESCKGKWKYISGVGSTENQYKKISGNWVRYFSRLVSRSLAREALTEEALIELLAKQDGKCALTGLTLTCTLEKGNRTWTNASIDRIIPGGPYVLDNIRLVCARVNIMRSNMSDDELRYWCSLITQKEVSPNAT